MNVLGIDYGTRKIGIALGSSITKTARPLSLLPVDNTVQESLKKLLTTWRVQKIVLGHPGDDPRNTALLESLNDFKKNSLDPLGIPIDFWTEQGSSQEAQMLMSDYPNTSRDAIAAMLVLQSYLENSKIN